MKLMFLWSVGLVSNIWKQSEKCWNAWKMSLIMEKHFLSGLMCTLCKSWSQTKTSLNFKAGYHVKYTFNAPTGIIVIAEHQFAMFGAMYLWEVTWQQINSWSHWDLMLSLAACVCMCVFLSVESKADKQRVTGVLIITGILSQGGKGI